MPVLGSAQVLVATIATFCMIGLGFLYRPSRASAIWSIAFVVVLIGSSAESVAVARGIDLLRAGSTGVLLSTTAFVWSGLRAYRGAPSLVAIPSATAIAGAVILPLTLGGPAYPWTFRVLFGLMGLYAALTVVETFRGGGATHANGASVPLAAFSVIVSAVTVVSLAIGFSALPESDGPADLLSTLNALGLLAYTVCALVTLLFLTRGDSLPSLRTAFHAVASDRLLRAQASGERSWSLIVIRLDDADELRTVAGDAGFAAIADRLHADIVEIFPTEADIGRLDAACFAVLVAQPATVVRERVRTLLRAVATPVLAVQTSASASIGWATVAENGYEFDAMLAAARTAADRAAAAGGDRWERALS